MTRSVTTAVSGATTWSVATTVPARPQRTPQTHHTFDSTPTTSGDSSALPRRDPSDSSPRGLTTCCTPNVFRLFAAKKVTARAADLAAGRLTPADRAGRHRKSMKCLENFTGAQG
jgi:hypothetical protein